MNQFRIAADSSCNLLTLNGADFVSVPLTIRTETEEFRDDASLDVDAMVSTLRSTKGPILQRMSECRGLGKRFRRERRRDRVYHYKQSVGQL